MQSRYLILFRHAKSDWDASSSSDHERPLSRRGIRAAQRMGKLLADSGQLPELILCSTALRARQTLELSAGAGSWEAETIYEDGLYNTRASQVLAMLEQISPNIDSVMLVGHEPAWSSLAGLLTDGNPPRFPTAAMARIDFNTQGWSTVGLGTGQLRWLLQPKFFS